MVVVARPFQAYRVVGVARPFRALVEEGDRPFQALEVGAVHPCLASAGVVGLHPYQALEGVVGLHPYQALEGVVGLRPYQALAGVVGLHPYRALEGVVGLRPCRALEVGVEHHTPFLALVVEEGVPCHQALAEVGAVPFLLALGAGAGEDFCTLEDWQTYLILKVQGRY